MRMRKITETKGRPTLEVAAKDFLSIRQAQMLSSEMLHDYEVQLRRFFAGAGTSAPPHRTGR